MLDEAASNSRLARRANIDFALADDEMTNAPEQFDFVMSHMVLQHVPVRRGFPLLLRLLDKVRPGGGFHIHLSSRTESSRQRALYWASANVPGVKLAQNLLAGRRWNAPAMQMNHYPVEQVLAQLAARQITELLVETENHGRFVTYGLIGRKPVP
jgi:trans-aconitate methyltransferase